AARRGAPQWARCREDCRVETVRGTRAAAGRRKPERRISPAAAPAETLPGPFVWRTLGRLPSLLSQFFRAGSAFISGEHSDTRYASRATRARAGARRVAPWSR